MFKTIIGTLSVDIYCLMKKTLCFLLILFALSSLAQKLHTPSEILKIMEKSEVAYSLEELKAEIACRDYGTELNDMHKYVVVVDSQYQVREYAFTPKTKALYQRAENFFGDEKYDSAKACYERLIKADTSLYFVYTMLGQIEEIRGNSVTAVLLFRRAIEKNFYDYMPHWFMADHLYALGNSKDALEEIVIARILNRNNLRIKSTFEKIVRSLKLSATDICFTPQCEIENPAGTVIIKTHSLWTGYALTKAVWEFEPNYSDSMGVQANHFSSLEEREALVSLYITTKTDARATKYPYLVMFNKAMAKGRLDEFIFYEIVLRQHPNVVYSLNPAFINAIKNYVIEVRQKI